MVEIIIGIIGAVLVLGAFLFAEFVPSFNQRTIKYNVLNILGSGMLTWYAFLLSSWPFVILNFIWMVAAIIKVVGILKKEKYEQREYKYLPSQP